MNEIDSNIYVIHKIYEHLRKKKKIPKSITYEKWCKDLRKSNGKLHVIKNNKSNNISYNVKYKEIDCFSIPNEINNRNDIEIRQFKGLSTKIPYTNFEEFLSVINNNGASIYFDIRKQSYSITYDYETDDEIYYSDNETEDSDNTTQIIELAKI